MSVQFDAACYLHKFVDFASKNDGDAIAKFDEVNNLRSRKISVNTEDHLRGFFNWKFHGEENAARNNLIRQEFILNVLKCLGWDPTQHGIEEGHVLTQAEIKEAVNTLLAGPENKARRTALLDALKVKDYGCGKPLTAHRISATLEQVKTIVESRGKRDDFWVVDQTGSGAEERLADLDSNINARILRRLEPDVEVLATPGNDDLLPGGNAPVERQESFESNQSENLSEKLSFQGDGDIIGGDGIGEDDNDDIMELFEGNVSKEKQEIPAQNDYSVKKNTFSNMVRQRAKRNSTENLMKNFIFSDDGLQKIYAKLNDRLYVGQDGESADMENIFAIAEALRGLRWTPELLKGGLDAVVRELQSNDSVKGVDKNILRGIAFDILTDYNEQQKDENLRVAIS